MANTEKEKLMQNNLHEYTTDMGFVKVINDNAGETVLSLSREVTLEDGTTVIVEGVTPNKMKSALNINSNISYKTPGEITYDINWQPIDGLAQLYNYEAPVPVYEIDVKVSPIGTIYVASPVGTQSGNVVFTLDSDEAEPLTVKIVNEDDEEVDFMTAEFTSKGSLAGLPLYTYSAKKNKELTDDDKGSYQMRYAITCSNDQVFKTTLNNVTVQ